jgi:ABC-type polysaccharide/polyol phosphate transport system ATPase subunit
MAEPIIQLTDVGMRFRLYLEKTHTLKEVMLNVLKRRHGYRDLWALRHVSFAVKAGESVGVIGRNGSGKSTLLKVIAGVFEPTTGMRSVCGSVASLIELGAGFNAELTGRENVFLNGAIMGLSKAAMLRRYDRIVDFAELHDFMDVPVKNYSSGMYARLGFAIATDVDADVLLIDEILSVGDEAFQRKSYDRIAAHLKAGKTVVFVSHDADTVQELCQRAIVLDHGEVVGSGPTGEMIAAYRRLLSHETVAR